MHKLIEFIVIIVIFVVLACYFSKKYTHDSVYPEKFTTNSNWDNNLNEVAFSLDYGKDNDIKGMYKQGPSNPMGPSQDIGVNQNSGKNVFDNRGYAWLKNGKDSQIDEFTKEVNDVELKNKFERMYMLDPDGSVAKYDITYNKISPNCCPAQYAPPFKLTDKDSTNCDFAQKYVANQYSGMNFNDGYGCACVTPTQADFYGSRGGNTD